MERPFPKVVATWQKPEAYSGSIARVQGVFFVGLIAVGVVMMGRKTTHEWAWIMAGVMFVGASSYRWIRQLGPSLFPLAESRVTLFEDRITRQSGGLKSSIALDHISACYVWTQPGGGGWSYTILKFNPTVKGFLFQMPGRLAETAVVDPEEVERIVEYLRIRGLEVFDRRGVPDEIW